MSTRPRRLATLTQTARHLDVSERTVRNYVARGYFPAYKQRGKLGLLFDLAEVDRYVASLGPRRARAAGGYGPKATVIVLPAQVEVVE